MGVSREPKNGIYLFIGVFQRLSVPQNSRVHGVGPGIHKQPVQIGVFDQRTELADGLFHLRNDVRATSFVWSLRWILEPPRRIRRMADTGVLFILGAIARYCSRHRDGRGDELNPLHGHQLMKTSKQKLSEEIFCTSKPVALTSSVPLRVRGRFWMHWYYQPGKVSTRESPNQGKSFCLGQVDRRFESAKLAGTQLCRAPNQVFAKSHNQRTRQSLSPFASPSASTTTTTPKHLLHQQSCQHLCQCQGASSAARGQLRDGRRERPLSPPWPRRQGQDQGLPA